MMGIDEIKRRIPHRPPALLIDGVTAVAPGKRLAGHKTLTGRVSSHDCSRWRPAYPTYLLIESWAQAALLLVLWNEPLPNVFEGRFAQAGALDDVRIVGRAYPGDVLEHRVRMVRAARDDAVLLGETVVGSSPVLEIGYFLVVRFPVDQLRTR
jgi:3-hydroxyacyl-[acyl-carrier-protein] dehydratase